MSKISVKKESGNIVITIPCDLIKFISENNPEGKTKIHNNEAFCDAVVEAMESKHIGSEQGLSVIEHFIGEQIDYAEMMTDDSVCEQMEK